MAVAQSGSTGLELPENVVVSRLDELASWCRKNSLWPMPFATACCGIELMATGAAKHDLARFGAEVFRFSPRQCDLMMMMMMMMMMIMMMMIMMMMTTTMMMMTMMMMIMMMIMIMRVMAMWRIKENEEEKDSVLVGTREMVARWSPGGPRECQHLVHHKLWG